MHWWSQSGEALTTAYCKMPAWQADAQSLCRERRTEAVFARGSSGVAAASGKVSLAQASLSHHKASQPHPLYPVHKASLVSSTSRLIDSKGM